jgi:hypothetical protein
MKTLRLLAIALCLTATGAQAWELSPDGKSWVQPPEPPVPTQAEVKAGLRGFCDEGRPGRDLTVAECKREIAWTIRTFKNAGPNTNLGVRVTACSDYCKTLYPKLPGY